MARPGPVCFRAFAGRDFFGATAGNTRVSFGPNGNPLMTTAVRHWPAKPEHRLEIRPR